MDWSRPNVIELLRVRPSGLHSPHACRSPRRHCVPAPGHSGHARSVCCAWNLR